MEEYGMITYDLKNNPKYKEFFDNFEKIDLKEEVPFEKLAKVENNSVNELELNIMIRNSSKLKEKNDIYKANISANKKDKNNKVGNSKKNNYTQANEKKLRKPKIVFKSNQVDVSILNHNSNLSFIEDEEFIKNFVDENGQGVASFYDEDNIFDEIVGQKINKKDLKLKKAKLRNFIGESENPCMERENKSINKNLKSAFTNKILSDKRIMNKKNKVIPKSKRISLEKKI